MMRQSINIGIFLLFSMSTVHAAELSKGVKLGGVTLRPSLAVNIQQDDNLFAEDSNETDVTLTEYIPGFTLSARNKRTGFNISYRYVDGNYDDSPEDDYTDSYFGFDADFILTRRNKLELSAEANKKHDARASDDSDFLTSEEPDEFDENRLGLQYTFGRQAARGRLVFSLDYLDKEYTNTITTDEDREELSLGTEFYLRTSTRTNLLVEVVNVDSDYTDDPASVNGALDTLDSERNQAFLGFKWQFTAKTAGEVKLGYISRDFDDDDRDDFSGFGWRIDTSWAVDSKSVIRFNSSREDDESDDGISGGFIDVTSYSLGWNRQWNNKIDSTLTVSYVEEDYVDFSEEREDTLNKYAFRINYGVSRWADIGFSVDHTDNDSTSPRNLDYERNRLSLHLVAKL